MEPSQDLRALGRRYRKLRGDLDELRPDLVAAIRADAARGVRQVDIVESTGYTREMVRRIVAGAA